MKITDHVIITKLNEIAIAGAGIPKSEDTEPCDHEWFETTFRFVCNKCKTTFYKMESGNLVYNSKVVRGGLKNRQL